MQKILHNHWYFHRKRLQAHEKRIPQVVSKNGTLILNQCVRTLYQQGYNIRSPEAFGLWRLYSIISPFLLYSKYTNDRWNNLDSGPLFAQAMDSTEFRKSTICGPCPFEALAGPETGRVLLDKNHPNFPDWVTKPKRSGTAPVFES